MNVKSNLKKRAIIFTENNQERIFPANTDEELAESCLLILRERYSNPIWGYQPYMKNISDEEKDFIEYWENDAHSLPALLYRQGKRTYERLKDNISEDTDPDWVWYHSVEELLSLKPDKAIAYKVGYGGRLIPTAYYLLLKRKDYPNENFVLAELRG
jgi:hypothetical protein